MAEVLVNFAEIEHNVHFVQRLRALRGVELVAVAKGCNGFLPLFRLFQQCGVKTLAMSRVGDAMRAEPFLPGPPLFLSLPAPHLADAVTRYFGASLNSELTTIHALAEASERNRRTHGIILMVEIGDLREGVLPEDLLPLVRTVLDLNNPFINLLGIGATLGCCCGTLPDRDNIRLLEQLAEDIEQRSGYPLRTVSLGGSVILPWLEDGSLPSSINHVRIGEAILLGNIPTIDQPHPALSSKGFILRGTVLEVKTKSSMPTGLQGKDVFGQKLTFQDRGLRLRCILDFGMVDTYPRRLTSQMARLEYVNSNSDYTMVDVTNVERTLKSGDSVDFSLNYQALIRVLHSQHVKTTVLAQPTANEGGNGENQSH